jgi:hypothetical protein
VSDETKSEDYLLFNGKKLFWKSKPKKESTTFVNKYVWKYAVSGLKKNNPHIKKLIKRGRDDIKKDTDYTDPKYQSLSSAGPIPSGTYILNLSNNMKFEKSGGGWGTGGWSIYPTNPLVRRAGFLEGKFDVDLPWIRSGFFLHEDGGRDGTAGCIGLSKQGIKNLKHYLQIHTRKTSATQIIIKVDYDAKD